MNFRLMSDFAVYEYFLRGAEERGSTYGTAHINALRLKAKHKNISGFSGSYGYNVIKSAVWSTMSKCIDYNKIQNFVPDASFLNPYYTKQELLDILDEEEIILDRFATKSRMLDSLNQLGRIMSLFRYTDAVISFFIKETYQWHGDDDDETIAKNEAIASFSKTATSFGYPKPSDAPNLRNFLIRCDYHSEYNPFYYSNYNSIYPLYGRFLVQNNKNIEYPLILHVYLPNRINGSVFSDLGYGFTQGLNSIGNITGNEEKYITPSLSAPIFLDGVDGFPYRGFFAFPFVDMQGKLSYFTS